MTHKLQKNLEMHPTSLQLMKLNLKRFEMTSPSGKSKIDSHKFVFIISVGRTRFIIQFEVTNEPS